MDFTSPFWQKAADQSFSILILCIAVWWLNRGNTKWAKAAKAAMDGWNKERSERIDKLEKKVNDCETDRARLWDRMLEIAVEFGRSVKAKPPEVARLIPGENGR